MMRYVIKEKFWFWGDDFYIFDEKEGRSSLLMAKHSHGEISSRFKI